MLQSELIETLKELESMPVGCTTLGWLELYYIGNCSALVDTSRPMHYPFNYDDRSWAVTLKDWTVDSNRNHGAPHNLNLGRTVDVEALTRDELIFRLGQQIGAAARAKREAEKGAF